MYTQINRHYIHYTTLMLQIKETLDILWIVQTEFAVTSWIAISIMGKIVQCLNDFQEHFLRTVFRVCNQVTVELDRVCLQHWHYNDITVILLWVVVIWSLLVFLLFPYIKQYNTETLVWPVFNLPNENILKWKKKSFSLAKSCLGMKDTLW